jgi:hypothetical protein
MGGNSDSAGGAAALRPLDATVLQVKRDQLLVTLDKADSDVLQRRLLTGHPPGGWRLDQSVRDTTAR